MQNKENQIKNTTTSLHSKLHLGNDYVLKRYRLQENHHFKTRNTDDLTYFSPCSKKDQQEQQHQAQQDVEQELVLVPLQLQPQQVEEDEGSKKQEENKNPADMIYVFDDEQEGLSEHKSDIQPIEQKQQITFKSKVQGFNDITWTDSERVNVSTAEYVTPKDNKCTQLLNSPNINKQEDETQRPLFQRKGAINFNEVRLQSEPKFSGLMGVEFLPQKFQKEGISINIVDKKAFSLGTLPPGIVLRCIIKRTTSLLNLLSPEYDLYLANGLKHILSAKKYPMRNRQLFKFSTESAFSNSQTLAIMHANTNHNVYWLLDQPKLINFLDISFLHLIVGYYRIKKGQQRKFCALLPETKDFFRMAIHYDQPFLNFADFKEEIKVQLNNLQQWEGQSQNSKKNFVLADEEDGNSRYLELKKVSENVFELSVEHPLSPLQAMAIAMTRFDAQLT